MGADESNPGMWPCDEETSDIEDVILKISAVYFKQLRSGKAKHLHKCGLKNLNMDGV